MEPKNGFLQLSHHDSWKVNLLSLEVCQFCGAHSNGLLGSFFKELLKAMMKQVETFYFCNILNKIYV